MDPAAITATLPGYYGKLPAHGDFLARRVPQAVKAAWDGWLEPALHQAQAALGPEWDEIYLTSPIWRFVLAPDLAGPEALIGVMMPSVDRVGRQFPLSLMIAVASGPGAFAWAGAAADWLARAEFAALDALRHGLDSDALDRQVQALGAPQMPGAVAALPHGLGWTLPDGGAAAPAGPFGCLLDQMMGPVRALWWTHGSDRVDPCLVRLDGLPDPACYQAMLTGWRGQEGCDGTG